MFYTVKFNDVLFLSKYSRVKVLRTFFAYKLVEIGRII